jgi:hypothetical protein
MGPDEFQSLKDSIEIIGIQNPITLYEGMVLDGWHRYCASQDLDMPCPEVELGNVDPVDFVKAQNKERRHLTVGAWALIEAELWDWRPSHRPPVEKGAPGAPFSKTVGEMAASAGASERTMRQAGKVKREAIPAIKDAVKVGAVSLKAAHAVAHLPEDEQAALAAAGSQAIKEAARTVQQKPRDGTGVDAPSPAPSRVGPSDEEIAALEAAEEADRAFLAKLLDSDDKLSTAHAEIVRLNALAAGLQQRVNGLLNEKAQAIQAAKRSQAKADRLQKELDALRGVAA